MPITTRSAAFAAALLFAAVLITYADLQAAETTDPSVRSVDVELSKGQLLSIITLQNRDTNEARETLAVYAQGALRMAQEAGFINHGTMRVTETVVGNETPDTVIVATWPSEAADLAFEASPELQPYKAMRPIIWDNLRFFKDEADQATALRFREDKHYTIAFAWYDPAASNDYRDYLDSVKPAVDAAGGRFIHSMFEPRYVSQDAPPPGPDEINIVEWDTHESLDAFQNSATFLEHYEKLHSGTTRFELYRIEPVFR